MDPHSSEPDYRTESDTVTPAVDRTLQALHQLLRDNREQTEAHAAAVQKQVLAVQERFDALVEKRAAETERRNQELFKQLQRETLATHSSLPQAVTASQRSDH